MHFRKERDARLQELQWNRKMPCLRMKLGILAVRATARLVIGLAVALVTALVPAGVAAAAGRFSS